MSVSDRPTGLAHFLGMIALGMGGFAIGTTEFAAMSLLPYFADGLNITEPTAGHVISAYALGVVIGAPVLAVLGARLPRWLLLILLMSAFALFNLLSAFSPNYETMLVFRFLSGVPHGAYFGVASLVAASLVPSNKRAQAVSQVFLGLTIATIIGVPAASWLGQSFGWRWGFAIVGALAALTVLLIYLYAPRDRARPEASPLKELTALKSRQVWLTIMIGAIGFGGMFAVYTYVTSVLLQVLDAPEWTILVVLAVFGCGITVGNLTGAWLADKALMPATAGILLWSMCVLLIYPTAAQNIWTLSICVFLVGGTNGLAPALQTRLMDVAGEAQTLAAALNHSSFNMANALGPFLSGLAVSAGFGLTNTGYVGASLAFGGFLIWLVAVWGDRRSSAIAQAAE
ncbi:MFS transporter [Ponticaulis sp.]|uniref:MFS transporter n=1 Tax=Ponticaulis sp. TaxID=2020902 RepID=UPI000C539595|nr:MFS transporter [Ponticaulis sp.]MBN03336.1 MFS transporter [Ponticaulis sp.]